jgi:hypothetical protein
VIRLLVPVALALALALVAATGGDGHAQPPASCGITARWDPSITQDAFRCLRDAYRGGCRPTQAVFTTDAGSETIVERVRLYGLRGRCIGDVEAETTPQGEPEEQPLAPCGRVALVGRWAIDLADCGEYGFAVVLAYCPPDAPHAEPSPDARLYLC